MSDLISVILPNYNHEKYIDQSIQSILNQTYSDIELIIVDDGSTDNSRDVIRTFNKNERVRTVFLNENCGKWYALNHGISYAQGRLIAIQDADDYACPEKLDRQYQCLKALGSFHNLCGMFHCFSQEDIDQYKNTKYGSKPINSYIPHKDVTKLVYQGKKMPGINHFYVGNDFEVHGGSPLFYKQLHDHGMKFLPGNMGLRCSPAEDGDFNVKASLLLQKTSVLKEKLYCYRRNSATNPAFKEAL